MSFYQLIRSQKVNASLGAAWEFIASPKNLKEITPDYMGFDITSNGLPEKIYAGMIITYEVSPLLGIKVDWVTEITHVFDGCYFVDEQRVGPYKMWHHQHFLEEVSGGVLMKDIVTYQLPFGLLGDLMDRWVIQPKLNEIFDYRRHAIEAIFGHSRG